MRSASLTVAAVVFAVLAAPAHASSLDFATYLGGRDFDSGQDVAVDAAGNTYVLSYAESRGFPTTNRAFDTKIDGFDAVVSKLDPTGSQLIWSTAVGGSAAECAPGCGLAIDDSGAAYVVGSTQSADFPTTPGAFDRTHEGRFEAFVSKLSPSGGALVYSTFLGGAGDELGFSVAVDDSGAAYVAGGTHSADFPTTAGAFDATLGGPSDAYVAKLDPSGRELLYGTFLGGSGSDDAFGGLAVDDSGAVYVSGETQSADFPATAGALDTALDGGSDGFVTKLAPGGGALAYSTFLGGGAGDFSLDLQVDAAGAAFVAGDTQSADFPVTAGAFDTTHGGDWDGYAAKLDAAGASLAYATFLGASGADRAAGVALPGDGTAVIAGYAGSPKFPVTAGAFDRTYAGGDGFVSTLGATGSGLVDSTLLGGSAGDDARAVALGPGGARHVTGATVSGDFPTTPGAFDRRFDGRNLFEADAFVAKLAP